MPLEWKRFVDQIALEKCLDAAETETMQKKFPAPNEIKNGVQVGLALNITDGAVKKRLEGVYSKFEILGSGRKEKRLQSLLQSEFNRRLSDEQIDSQNIQVPIADIREACYRLLERQKRLTTNSLMAKDGITFEPDDLFVPLGLVERKKRPKRRDIESSDQGSQLYGATEEEITQKFNHQEFFDQVIRDGETKSKGKRLAIIGEPGAGKTTLLQKIGDWSRDNDQVPIWISLANVGTKPIQEYLLEDWLQDAAGTIEPPPQGWKTALQQLLTSNQACLLLDGVDEMAVPNALRWIGEQLRAGWANSVRVVLTCRLNVWESSALEGFDVYRNLDFDYPEQVGQFIDQFFKREGADPILGEGLKEELEKPGKERIRDTIKNPLRLSLLCYSWELGAGELPETKAELYRQFVNTFYELKQREFPITPEQQEELNQALARLAREAFDLENSRFRLRESFIKKILREPEQEGSLFWQARRLGWLNEVGVTTEPPNEKSHAFLHPTFQEYFAALAIRSRNYFLDHIPEDPNTGIYRLFEDQYKEVILFWLGRNDIDIKEKHLFLDEIIYFDKNCDDYYWHQAYFLAASFIGICRDYPSTENVIDEIIVCLLGKLDISSNIRQPFIEIIPEQAEKIIHETNCDVLTQKLIKVLREENEQNTLLKVFGIVRKIGTKKEELRKAIFTLFERSENKEVRRESAYTLKKLFPSEIPYMIRLLNQEEEAQPSSEFILSLINDIKLSEKDFLERLDQFVLIEVPQGVSVFFEKLSVVLALRSEDFQQGRILDSVKRDFLQKADEFNIDIDLDSITAFFQDALDEVLKTEFTSPSEKDECQEFLFKFIEEFKDKLKVKSRVDEKNVWIFVDDFIRQGDALVLIGFLQHYATNEVCEEHPGLYQKIYTALWECAKITSYPKFYYAWHGLAGENYSGDFENAVAVTASPRSIHNTNRQLELEKLVKLKIETHRPLFIKMSAAEEQYESIVCQRLWNRICFNFSAAKMPSKVKSIGDLERAIMKLNSDLNEQIPAIILYGTSPYSTLVAICQQLSDIFYIGWITDQPVPFRTFHPDSTDLVSAIQNWLDEIAQE